MDIRKNLNRQIYFIAAVFFILGYILRFIQVTQIGSFGDSNSQIKRPMAPCDPELPRPGPKIACVLTYTKPQFFICPYEREEDIHVSRWLRREGIWDGMRTGYLKSTLENYPESTLIDIGAHIGYFTVLAATVGNPVVAVEPYDRSVTLIRRSVALNHLNGKVSIITKAISANRTKMNLSQGDSNDLGSIRAIPVNEAKQLDKSESGIEAITIDDLMPFIKSKEVIIKISIEGHECTAMQTAIKIFQEKIVRYIFMEWHVVRDTMFGINPDCPTDMARELVSRLHHLGYTPYEYLPRIKPLAIDRATEWSASGILFQHKNSVQIL
ncbi:hypothetical protein CHS0354_037177 [Potamilus streckersoni]|uniref:Methyltransferase FkbM domain-containing protein n=1 Tax=Potamilus streckersoni TaxID=2493646 RepID=A0AAE0SXQ0_9BIVA|nr:hypothetical protein CHS0354_037177 [Potamilus streckersoni]